MSNDPDFSDQPIPDLEFEELLNTLPPLDELPSEPEPPTEEPESDEPQCSRRVAIFALVIRIIGWLAISVWALPAVAALLVFGTMLLQGKAGNPNLAEVIVYVLFAVASCTLLPAGLALLYYARLLRRGLHAGRSMAMILAIAAAILFPVQLTQDSPISFFFMATICVIAPIVIYIKLKSQRGLVVTLMILVAGIALTATAWIHEQAVLADLEENHIGCDVYMGRGGITFTHSGEIIAPGNITGNVIGGQFAITRWDYPSKRCLGTEIMLREQSPSSLINKAEYGADGRLESLSWYRHRRSQWDINQRSDILAIPWREGNRQDIGLYVYNVATQRGKLFHYPEKREEQYCIALKIGPQGDSCAVVSKEMGTVDLWNLRNGSLRTWTAAGQDITAAKLAFDPQERYLAVYLDPRTWRGVGPSPRLGIWSIQENATVQQRWCIDIPPVLDIKVTPDGSQLIVATGDTETMPELLCISTNSGKVTDRQTLGEFVGHWSHEWCAISPEADRLVIIRESSTEVWDVSRHQNMLTVKRERTLPFGVNERIRSDLSAIDFQRMRLITVISGPRRRYPCTDPSRFHDNWIHRWDLIPSEETSRP